ncbi:hypothetical protein LPJ73_006175 [Coemansia sp. RSA 2703]|nr:hypothetical protein LPJ73_006175 [Coemansia sp. RSA 2703]KAJ2366419.1 hypothetical protein IW150_005947 [Coemansia sp. RSA 2607]
MKLTTFGIAAVGATLLSMAHVGSALPAPTSAQRLARRDPVTKIIKYVLYGGDHNDTPHEEKPDYHKPASSYNPSQDERSMLCMVNKERRRVGLRPLTLHPAMTRAAHEHSEYQSRVRSMTHNDPQNGQLGSRLQRNGFSFASASENIAEAPNASIKDVFDMWMNDPPHYENIVDPNATYMGLACVNGFWTQDFGSGSDDGDAPQYAAHDYC